MGIKPPTSRMVGRDTYHYSTNPQSQFSDHSAESTRRDCSLAHPSHDWWQWDLNQKPSASEDWNKFLHHKTQNWPKVIFTFLNDKLVQYSSRIKHITFLFWKLKWINLVWPKGVASPGDPESGRRLLEYMLEGCMALQKISEMFASCKLQWSVLKNYQLQLLENFMQNFKSTHQKISKLEIFSRFSVLFNFCIRAFQKIRVNNLKPKLYPTLMWRILS